METGTRMKSVASTIRNRIKQDNNNLDRFIPNRKAMDFDYAHYMVTDGKYFDYAEYTNPYPTVPSPFGVAYRTLLADTLNMNRPRILSFNNKPPTMPIRLLHPPVVQRSIPKTSYLELDAPGIVDNFYTNVLDWGSRNVISVALGNTVYLLLLDGYDKSISQLVTVDEESGPVMSVKWAPEGRHIAIGLDNSEVQLWDSVANKMVRTLQGGHESRVGALDWNNNHVLTTGGMDGQIINHDVRVRDHIVGTYLGHLKEVCGLKWSTSGQQLASGGDDNLLHIWDISHSTRPLHKIEDHSAAVKALAWCPFQRNLLASGGGTADKSIKLWNTQSGACLNSVDTGLQVCALLWNKNEEELLSSHGFTQNPLILWKYPYMVKMAELTGHTSRVLHMAQSPDGCTVVSAAADETVRFWHVFGTPTGSKPASKASALQPFARWNCIR